MGAVLVAASAAHSARRADQLGRAGGRRNAIGAQMAAALPRATLCTLGLAGVAHIILADRAAANVFSAGPLSAGPTLVRAAVTIFLLADRADRHATGRAEQI